MGGTAAHHDHLYCDRNAVVGIPLTESSSLPQQNAHYKVLFPPTRTGVVAVFALVLRYAPTRAKTATTPVLVGGNAPRHGLVRVL